jgi:HK97 family phage portal protein
MGRLARLAGRVLGRKPEERADGWGWSANGSLTMRGYGATEPINPNVAQSLSAVCGCVELISAAIGSLPASLVVDTPEGRVPAPPTAPAWRLLTRPNQFQSWPAFATSLAAAIVTEGNSVSYLPTDLRGEVVALIPAPWPWLLPSVVSAGGVPRLVFDCLQFGLAEALLLGIPRRMLADDVLHVKARSDFGIVGRSVLSRAAGPVREGLAITETAASMWAQGLRPSGIYSTEGTLDEAARKRFRQSIAETAAGPANAGRVLILDRGGKYQPVSMTSAEAEFLASRAFNVEDVCRLFSVPSMLLQLGSHRAAPTDLAPFTAALANQALAPIVNAIESEIDHSVLPPGMHLVLDMSGLQRGSYSAVMAALCAGTQSGITTANDARKSLGLPPLEGGDVLRTSSAPNWPADATGMPAMGPKPGPTGTGLPEPGHHANEGAA